MRRIDSDSPDYEEMYAELEKEYADQIYATTVLEDLSGAVTSDPEWANENNPPDTLAGNTEEPIATKSDARTSSVSTDLNCGNPWFWNTFRCVWIDVRSKKVTKRTRKNAKVAGITLGVVCLFTVVPLCWFCIVALYLRSRVSKYASMMDRYMKEYMPGSIILPNGEVKYYDPTPEEEEAFEDLIHIVSSPV